MPTFRPATLNAVPAGKLPRRCGLAAALVAATALTALAVPARAETLPEALVLAYRNNPDLQAARAALRVVDEQVPQALANGRPSVGVTATQNIARTDNDPGEKSTSRSTTLGLSVQQPLYRGGRTDHEVSQAEDLVRGQRASLEASEQSVLLSGAVSYLDVIRDVAAVDLQVNQARVLQRQLEASNDRFRVGEITRTDVSQAEARLARAIADRQAAEGQLSRSRATYQRVIGKAPEKLEAPSLQLPLPGTEDEAVTLAETENPSVIAAGYNLEASRRQIDIVEGTRLPEVSLEGSLSRRFDWSRGNRSGTALLLGGGAGASSNTSRTTAATAAVRVTIPLYNRGITSSQIRASGQTVTQRQAELEGQQRLARENAQAAWQTLVSARAEIKARRSEIDAAQVAAEGVRQETLVGSRTTLDQLDSEQDLLNARVALIQAERDLGVATFNLLTAVGRLTADDMRLNVERYNPEENYLDVRDRWYGTDIVTPAPAPTGVPAGRSEPR